MFDRHVEVPERGDQAKKKVSLCRRVSMSSRREGGFTLLELMVTLVVLTILTMGVMPLVKVSVRRQREQRLRESLREMTWLFKSFIGTQLVCSAPHRVGT